MSRLATELSVRSNHVLLPGSPPGRWSDLLHAEAHQDTWRIVELFSVAARPFEAELAWSAGRGVGASAKVSVASATRVALYARGLQIRARNASIETNRVGITVADGHGHTSNQWEVRGEVHNAAPLVVSIPPFASTVRLDLADPTAVATTSLQLVDGGGVVRAQFPAALGVQVGAATEVRVLGTASSSCRLVFDLNL